MAKRRFMMQSSIRWTASAGGAFLVADFMTLSFEHEPHGVAIRTMLPTDANPKHTVVEAHKSGLDHLLIASSDCNDARSVVRRGASLQRTIDCRTND